MRVLGIDPGMRNMAFCVLDDGAVFDIGNTDLFHGKPIDPKDVCALACLWCEEHKAYIDSADVIVCEKQFMDSKIRLSACLIIIQTVIEVFSRSKFIPVHAMSVKRAYGTISTSHKKNKIKSIERVSAMNPELFAGVKGKIDDMSDAYLLAHFYTFHLHQHKKFLCIGQDDNERVETVLAEQSN
ncbi:MAG: hypothetical protein WB421_17830 [Terriglobales bacterium]